MSDKTADQLREAEIQRAKSIAERLAKADSKLVHHVLLGGDSARPRGDSGRFEISGDDEQDIPELWPSRNAAGR